MTVTKEAGTAFERFDAVTDIETWIIQIPVCVKQTMAPILPSAAAGSLALCFDVDGDYGFGVDGVLLMTGSALPQERQRQES